jgi:hypothetical protein
MSGRGKGKIIVLDRQERKIIFIFQVEKVLEKVVPNVIVKYFEITFKVSKLD